MKMLIGAMALAIAITSPALVQAAGKKAHAKRQLSAQTQVQASPQWQSGERPDPRFTQRSANPANDARDSVGRYIGTDPDPQIRSMMMRERRGGAS